ncbi:MAG: Cellulose-binding domain protein [Ramlibacter sp.]|nr:Cellulose-binding domain protein [Ramlibacter sp.]
MVPGMRPCLAAACVIAMMVGGAASAQGPAQPPAIRTAEVGVNIEGIADWTRLSPFVDLMKSSRAWGLPDKPWEQGVRTDALGWPLQDAGVVVKVLHEDAGDPKGKDKGIDAGVYRLSFQGRATVRPVASDGVSVRKLSHNAATRQTTAEVVVTGRATQLMLAFEGTDGGVRNVQLVPSGTPAGQVMNPLFREAVAPFGTLRLMDFLSTNGNPVRTWSERTTPASATQSGERGAAYEYAVQIANELGKDIWINIPVAADDAYVRALAELLHKTLAPGRVVYVEYSNELWNSVFPQTEANRQAAIAEAAAGDTTLTKGRKCTADQLKAGSGDCNAHWAGYFRVGKRTVRIAQIFSEVFGPGALNNRVRVVYATQFADRSKAEQVLKNIATYRGKPASFLYGVAGAPYFYLDEKLAQSPTLSAQAIHASLTQSLEREVLPFFAPGITKSDTFRKGVPYRGEDWVAPSQKALADYYGIKSLAYEGGPDLRQADVALPAKFAANADARMGAYMDRLLGQWFGCGNGLFVHFTLTSSYGRYGYWGLTNDPRDLRSPKYQAVAGAARRPATDYRTCN